MFLLKEHMFLLASSLTNILCKIYSSIEVLLISNEIKDWEAYFYICYDTFYIISSLYKFLQHTYSVFHRISYSQTIYF